MMTEMRNVKDVVEDIKGGLSEGVVEATIVRIS